MKKLNKDLIEMVLPLSEGFGNIQKIHIPTFLRTNSGEAEWYKAVIKALHEERCLEKLELIDEVGSLKTAARKASEAFIELKKTNHLHLKTVGMLKDEIKQKDEELISVGSKVNFLSSKVKRLEKLLEERPPWYKRWWLTLKG